MGEAATATMTSSSSGSLGSGGSLKSKASMDSNNPQKGILTNGHEAPKKPAKAQDSSFRGALRSAFIPPQPGKQMKTNGKPLGKTFERTQPLPQRHEGGEVLKVDPRGESASIGDGIILSPTGESDDEGSIDAGSSPSRSGRSGTSTTDQSSERDESSSVSGSGRGRSDTVSSSASQASSSASSSSKHIQIKFCPLPTSGRLKRANSITIGVAARSQLLHSQGGGRHHNYNPGGAYQQRMPSGSDLIRHQSGPQQGGTGKNAAQQRASQEPIDLGEEFMKGASRAWNKVRRGSSVSSGSSSSGQGSAAGSTAKKGKPAVDAVMEEEHEGAGEKTPRRPSSPVHAKTAADHANISDDDDLPEGARTPRSKMQRRVSTGAFTGAQSFMSIEDRRKHQYDDEEAVSGDPEEDELSAQFAEKLGRAGAAREMQHEGAGVQRTVPDGSNKDTEVVEMSDREKADKKARAREESASTSESDPDDGDASFEQSYESAQTVPESGSDVDEDDEETREAERLADQALHGHSAQALKAGGVEKMERKRGNEPAERVEGDQRGLLSKLGIA